MAAIISYARCSFAVMILFVVKVHFVVQKIDYVLTWRLKQLDMSFYSSDVIDEVTKQNPFFPVGF